MVVLKKRSDFLRIKENGHRVFPNSWIILNYSSNDLGYQRWGWTISKRVGGAVVRNRLKRWCREVVKESVENEFEKGVDINVIFRKKEKDFYKKMVFGDFRSGLEKGKKRIFQSL